MGLTDLLKKKTSSSTAKKEEEQLPIMFGDIDVTEHYNNDAEFKALIEERKEIFEQSGSKTQRAEENGRKVKLRLEELTSNNGPTVGELVKQAKGEQRKEEAAEKRTSKSTKSNNEDPSGIHGKEVVVQLYNNNTSDDGFNYTVVNKYLEGEQWHTVKEGIMVHRNNLIPQVQEKLGEGAIIGGVAVWDDHPKKRRYNLLNVKLIKEPSGKNPTTVFEKWLKENTLTSTSELEKSTMTDIGALITGIPVDQVEAKLNEKYPKGMNVIHGTGNQREFYYEK